MAVPHHMGLTAWARLAALGVLYWHCFAEVAHVNHSPSRVIAIADLHGDFDNTIAILRAAKLAEEDDVDQTDPQGRPFTRYRGIKWTGGDVTLVQLGDLVDRGRYARDLYALFGDLRAQAAVAGGRVVNLVGNHELMNLQGDLRYVSAEDIAEFGGSSLRAAAFSADGWIGSAIIQHFQAAVVAGQSLFVHAGLLPVHAEQGVDDLNVAAKSALQSAAEGGRRFADTLLKTDGPFWVRSLVGRPEEQACPVLSKTLELVKATRMIVGHTQVDGGEVVPKCEGSLLMADTIISKSAYPMCWHEKSMASEGCQGALVYVELKRSDDQIWTASEVRVGGTLNSGQAEAVTMRPLPLTSKPHPSTVEEL